MPVSLIKPDHLSPSRKVGERWSSLTNYMSVKLDWENNAVAKACMTQSIDSGAFDVITLKEHFRSIISQKNKIKSLREQYTVHL